MPEVYLSNVKYDSSFIKEIQKTLGLNSEIDLYYQFKKINNFHSVPSLVKKYIPSIDHLLNLIPEMYTPSRAKNNINPKPDLPKILQNSWNPSY